MKARIEKIKKDIKDEAMKAGLVILGAVTGAAVAKGLRKATESKPQLSSIVSYATPFLLGGGGIIIAAATEDKSKAKYFGYGLAVAGTFEGIKLIPVAKDMLSGIFGNSEIPAANAFYTESEERDKIMSGFGLAALPIGTTTMQDAVSFETRLPELEESVQKEDNLGFNPSATNDVDINGIL